MRLDDYLSTVGVIKRRTVAKEMGSNGLLAVNGHAAKPSYQVKVGDVVQVKGTHAIAVEVIDIPTGSVAKEQRDRYFKVITHADR